MSHGSCRWTRRLKALGERITARDPDRQNAEIQISIALINHLATHGTDEIVCVASSRAGEGLSRLRREY